MTRTGIMSGFSLRADRRRSAARRGFSLLEMLFVILIIGLIAALVLPRLGGAFGKAQVKTTSAQIAVLSSAVQSFKLDVGRYPTEQEGLPALLIKPAGAEGWSKPYLSKKTLPKDGWNHDFIYKLDPEFGFKIISYGADGKEGGDGENADLDSTL